MTQWGHYQRPAAGYCGCQTSHWGSNQTIQQTRQPGTPRRWPGSVKDMKDNEYKDKITWVTFFLHYWLFNSLVLRCVQVIYTYIFKLILQIEILSTFCETVYRTPLWDRADSMLASSQWETSLQSNAVSHWLGANLESALWEVNISSGNGLELCGNKPLLESRPQEA